MYACIHKHVCMCYKSEDNVGSRFLFIYSLPYSLKHFTVLITAPEKLAINNDVDTITIKSIY